MPNCSDCGANPMCGHLETCTRDVSKSRWARYRARKKVKLDTGSYYTSDPPLDPDLPALNEVVDDA